MALSDLAMEILDSLPRFVEESFVFPSPINPAKPVSGFVHAKQKVLDFMASPEPWRLHDLRRTCCSGMAKLGVAPHVADKVLNHTSGTIKGVAASVRRAQRLGRVYRAVGLPATGTG